MSTHAPLILRILIITALYFALSTYGGLTGWKILYPIRVFVTFLHEFGHAFGAIITGGSVEHIEIHPNAGGLTSSIGGNRSVIIAGGYIGSALFGNLLFYIGARRQKWVKPVLALVIIAMLVTGFIWYNTLFTTAILCAFAAILFFIGFKTSFGRDILMLLGLASVIYIIQDTGNGPSSDLKAFEQEFVIIPAKLWMFIWLAVALGLLALNIKMLFTIKDEPEKNDPKTGPRKRVNTERRYNPIKKR